MDEFNTPDGESGERVPALFEPDLLLASQYFDRVRGRRECEPERQLMIAVLDGALNDFMKNAGARSGRRRELFREVAEWVESREATWLFSFENICNVLGLDADYLRRGLRAWEEPERNVGEGKSPVTLRTSEPQYELRRASGE